MSLLPSTTEALIERLGAQAAECIDAAIGKIEHELRPVPVDKSGDDAWRAAIDERLRRLAVKVLPTARAADTQEWRSAMVDALSDLPAMVSLTAAKRAIHRPFRFIGDIETEVRQIADGLMLERAGRLAALRRHRDEIARAMAATGALPAPPAEREITAIEIRALTPALRSLGIAVGAITEDQVAAALADDHCSDYVPQQEAA